MSCKQLVLDAGPLLSLSPLRGIAESFVTVPQVLAELKDRRAKEHLERLGSHYGVKIDVMAPDPASLVAVIAKAKETGDYSVLSQADLSVLALTHTLHQKSKLQQQQQIPTVPSEEAENEALLEDPADSSPEHPPSSDEEEPETPEEDLEPLDVELQPLQDEEHHPEGPSEPTLSSSAPLFEDPSESDDGEGEWITPENVALHKSRALDLLPSNDKGKAKQEPIDVGCMTADFAMQNVLLQMGLNLVSTDGKRITKVKSWVLRCHACFKICKDSSKKFCPSCGNPSLLRTSVTIAAPGSSKNAPAMQVHLKPNFQYKIRGTKYSIPAPKPGSAKTGPGEGLILREDQAEYMRAKKRVDTKRERDEARLVKGIISKGAEGNLGALGSWMDPDWIPEMLTAGTGGKGRTVKNSRMDGDMPVIGHGRKNPNERRRRK